MSESLNQRQRKFLFNYLEKGMSATAAYYHAYGCKRANAGPAAFKLITKNNLIIAAIEEHALQEDIATKRALHKQAERAAIVLGEAMEAADTNARIRAAKEILDRTGHKPKDEIDITQKGDLNIRLELPEDLNIDDII